MHLGLEKLLGLMAVFVTPIQLPIYSTLTSKISQFLKLLRQSG